MLQSSSSPVPVDLDLAYRVLCVVDAGLVKGVGQPIPGRMCVEAAVNHAMGLPHGDDPPCVGSAVRKVKISLNDAAWSSDEERTKGLRRLSVAQLGSDTIDQQQFVVVLTRLTIQRVVPRALRNAASQQEAGEKRDRMEAAAVRCESEGTPNAAYAADAAADAAYAYAAASRDAELHNFADVVLAALRECNSPGVALLDAIEQAA